MRHKVQTVIHIETSAGARFATVDGPEDGEGVRQELLYYHNEVLPAVEEDEKLPDDATVEQLVEAIEEYENVSMEETYTELPKVYVLVIDSDSGGTSTDVFSTYRRALEYLCDDCEIDHKGKTVEELLDLLEAHFENSEDWYVLNEEEIQE
jgi:hypothetical protein